MVSSLHTTTPQDRKRHVRMQHHHHHQRTTRPFNLTQTFLQICFLICTTVLTLTSTTHAYPLLAVASSDNNNGTSSSPSTIGSMEDQYGRLILDVGQKTVISTRNWILGTLLIIVGLVQVFYGFKFIRLTLVLTGFVSWAVVATIIMVILRWDLVYFLFKPSHYSFWVWFLAGILGAILSFRYWDLGVAFSGGFGGFALAMGIIAAVNNRHGMTNTSRYILLGCLILIGAAIAIFYERFSIILGTSLGGAFMVMFGIDEFLQAGYREMIVIFGIAGKTLQYRPDRTVFIMIGCSLALACVGIAWEFWHHAKPLLMDRRALFRIYGRPFGKRPHKLAGQRLKRRVAQSDWYSYLAGCVCLRRRTAEEVLYDEGYDEAEAAAAGTVSGGTTTTPTAGGQSGGDDKTGTASETVVIVVDEGQQHSTEGSETKEDQPKPQGEVILLSGTEIIYGSGIESTIHQSESSSSSTLTTHTAAASAAAGPVEVVFTETSESVDENGGRITTTTTTTTTTTSGGMQEHRTEQYQHYSSNETRTHSQSTSSHQKTESSQSEMVRTESSESAHRAASTSTTMAREVTQTTSEAGHTSRTLLQSMAAHSSSTRTTTTTTTNGSGTTTVVSSQSSSSSP